MIGLDLILGTDDTDKPHPKLGAFKLRRHGTSLNPKALTGKCDVYFSLVYIASL
jgi:hypothetical protein